jgi:glycosyltransferase 2 family protein
MYMLMPASPEIDFISVMVIFITATLLGFAAHTPGGIGVFDATMLFALSQFDREELVGALLLIRLLYYIIPFALALSIVAIREFALDIKPFVVGEAKAPTEEAPIAEPAKKEAAASPHTPSRRRPRRRAPSTAV